MKCLTSDDIFDFDDTESVYVKTPEWSKDKAMGIFMSSMSGKKKEKFEKLIASEKDDGNIRATLVAMCAVDENGNKLFKTSDAKRLGDKNAKALQRCFNVARTLNGMDEDSVEEEVKN